MTFILAFIFLLLVVSAMSVGVIFANKPIKGSCGGMSALGIDTACDICGGDSSKCEKESSRSSNPSTDLAYDATKTTNK